MNENEICQYCGSRMCNYWHNITPGLVNALRKFSRAVGLAGKNEIHLIHDMKGDVELTRHEWNNFTKLRFFALVAKVRLPDGTHKSGYWLLTRRGSQFLKNLEAIPKKVQTSNNKVIGHSEEKVMVRDIPTAMSWFETKPEYEIAHNNAFIPVQHQQRLNIKIN